LNSYFFVEYSCHEKHNSRTKTGTNGEKNLFELFAVVVVVAVAVVVVIAAFKICS